MPLLPAVHPAIPISQHLIPGIKSWANNAVTNIANPGSALKGVDFSVKALENWYIHTDPLHSLLTFSSFLAIAVFLLGEVTTNWSSVDRIWAALPVVYSAWLTFHGHFTGAGSIKSLFSSNSSSFASGTILPFVPKGVDERMFLVFLLQCLWSARLTGNTLRRGFFNPAEEDYRWPIVRKRLPRWFWPIMNFSFVSVIQIALLAATALPPQYLLLTSTRAYHPAHPSTPFGYPDLIVAGLFILNLTIEQVADSQQQKYQNWKHSDAKGPKKAKTHSGKSPRQAELEDGSLKRGFLTSGLWAWSRHPNFLCEQLNFWILPLFTLIATVPSAVYLNIYENFKMSLHLSDHTYFVNSLKSASEHLLNYSWIIAIAMSVLFRSSTILTEAISSGKYPKYREYQKRVGMFSPFTTILKGVWLFVTGRLGSTNEQVYGSAKSKTQ